MQIRHALIGLDFRSPSLNAAAFALRRFRPARVTFAHVIEETRRGEDPLARVADSVVRLHETATTLGWPRASVEVVRGAPAEELRLLARDAGADLLCVGMRASLETGATHARRAVPPESSVSTLHVPQYPAAGVVHAIWRGTGPGEQVLRAASSIAERLGQTLNALCCLTEGQWTRTGPYDVEQGQLARILHQAQLAGVETVRINTPGCGVPLVRSLPSFVDAHGDGLLVCDDSLGRLIVDTDTLSGPDAVALARLRTRCPILSVATAALAVPADSDGGDAA